MADGEGPVLPPNQKQNQNPNQNQNHNPNQNLNQNQNQNPNKNQNQNPNQVSDQNLPPNQNPLPPLNPFMPNALLAQEAPQRPQIKLVPF